MNKLYYLAYIMKIIFSKFSSFGSKLLNKITIPMSLGMGISLLASCSLLQENNKISQKTKEFCDDLMMNKTKEFCDDLMMNKTKEFWDDLNTCIQTKVYSRDGIRYEIISGNYTYDPYECVIQKYLLRTRACACGNPDSGIEGSVHGIHNVEDK